MTLTIFICEHDFVVWIQFLCHVVSVENCYLAAVFDLWASHFDVGIGYREYAAGTIGSSTDCTETLRGIWYRYDWMCWKEWCQV